MSEESISPSATPESTAADPSADDPGEDETPDDESTADLELRARATVLAEENRRLRQEYVRARRTTYRRTAAGLAFVGLLAGVTGILFPDGREILFALGFTGLFGAVLTLYLSPSQVIAADVCERVYAAMATNGEALATQLGLASVRRYVPATERAASLFVPASEVGDLPSGERGPLVVAEGERGLLLDATGAFLFEEFERTVAGDIAAHPGPLATQLREGVTEQFELATAIEADVDADRGRVTFRVSGSAFGDLDRFDHPLPSFLAAGLVAGLDRPVSVEVEPTDAYADWLVTCRWES